MSKNNKKIMICASKNLLSFKNSKNSYKAPKIIKFDIQQVFNI
jgi:hypothetical protein